MISESSSKSSIKIEVADQTKKIEQYKLSIPVYQLAANENPDAVITHVQFNGANFDEWAQAMQIALRVKKK